jgi:catechol 2,3-dioxygenase-like lactoylglutathione lyase family enzyme
VRPVLKGIHHIKLAVRDLEQSLAFYQRVFGATIVPSVAIVSPEDGHALAYALKIPGFGNTMLQIRQNYAQAIAQRSFDPIALAVDDRGALQDWADYLAAIDVAHSPILPSVVGWVLILEDPDQNRIRIFTLEEHGPDVKADLKNAWVDS